MIFTGILFGRFAKFCKLPNVTGYLIGGLIIGPSVLGIVPRGTLEGFNLISEIALGFIAFTVGNEFKISYFKRVGATPIIIAALEALFAVLFVFIALMVAGNDVSFSIVLGSIAAATAPAATIMVINQYKSKGPVTETLLAVVALDDAAALILFGIAVSIAQAITKSSNLSMAATLISPFVDILGSLIIGAALGLLFTIPLRWFKKDSNRISITVGFVLAGIGIANLLGLSSLLLCMAMGGMFVNFSKQVNHIMKLSDAVTPPIFILFFVISGAELKLSVLPTIGVAGLIYVVFRVFGKLFGTYLGGVLSGADKKIRKYLGPTLLPQAGVAIGLSLVATTVVPEYGERIRGIILCATLIYEMIGPAITKSSLKKAGEIV